MNKNKVYTTTVEDSGDGTGDIVITLPEEMLNDMNWKEGQEFDISLDGHVIYLTPIKSTT